MLAARDQENLVHAHQTTAAGKPLNQGTRQLPAKTPGNRSKTPFKIPLNDENNIPALGGKKTLKVNGNGNENLSRPGKGGFGDTNAFVTPMAPRERAPLGMKTTNAKARAPQTPAPAQGTVKPGKTGRRASTARQLKHSTPQAVPVEKEVLHKEAGDGERDVEYMPPKPQELPDLPDDITYNTDFPQFKGRNLVYGLGKVYDDNETGPDGLTRKEREWRDEQAAYDKRVDEILQKQMDEMDQLSLAGSEFPDDLVAESVKPKSATLQSKQGMTLRTRNSRNIPTINSRSAAAALSQPSASTAMKPKAKSAPRPRVASILLPSKKKAPTVTNPSSMRHAAATASSKTTVGYSKGRNVSSTLHHQSSNVKQDKPVKKSILSPAMYMELYGPPPFGGEMWSRCKAAGYFDESEEGEAPSEPATVSIPEYEEDEETANFQLTL